MTTGPRGSTAHHTPHSWKYEAARLGDRLLDRSHLVGKLERHLGQQRASGDILLLSAPAGYGKTTLVAQWAQTTGVPVTWYHLDQTDSDPVVLIEGIVHALKRRGQRQLWDVERMIGRSHNGVLSPAELKAAAVRLAMDIRAEVKRPLALVITNVSALNHHRQALAVLDTLINRPPDNLRIVLESREVPRLRVSSLLAQRRLDGIGIDDLRLRDDEFSLLLEIVETNLDDAARARLSALADGWITGVLLASDALLPGIFTAEAGDPLDQPAVFDYLASEVIDALPGPVRAFAAEAAILRYMTVPLCEDVLGVSDAREHLAALERRTGFLTRIGIRPSEPVYRFQPLLRHALLDLLQRRTGNERIHALHMRAAEALEREGDLDEAVAHYVEAGSFDHVIGLIERHQGALLRAGRGMTVARWLDHLPDTVHAEHPDLLVLQAELNRQAGRIDEAYQAVQAAYAIAQPRAHRQRALLGRVLVERGATEYIRGEYESARKDCEEALHIAPKAAHEVQIQARFTLAACLTITVNPEAAEVPLAEAERLCLAHRNLWMLARLSYFRSKLHLARGTFREALDQALIALRYAEECEDEIGAIASRLNIGAARYSLGQMVAARADFVTAEEQSQAIGYATGRIYALSNLADLEAMSGNPREAISPYQQALALIDDNDDMHLVVHTVTGLARTLAVLRRTTEALDLLAAYLRPDGSEYFGADWGLLTHAAGFAWYQAGNFDQAYAYLTQAEESATAHGAMATIIGARLGLGAVVAARDRRDEAGQMLASALELSSREQSLSVTVLYYARYLPDLWESIRQSVHPAARPIQQKLSAWQYERAAAGSVSIPAGEGTLESTAAPVRVYTLGDARVLIGSERIMKWVRPRARELLFYLLDQEKPARRDAILDALWPDKDPTAADEDFRKARFQLKQIFHRPVVEQIDGKWRLALECWVDSREFERAAEEGQQFLREEHLGAAATAFRRAISYWDGPYLEDIYSEWAILRRESLYRRYLDALEHLADLELRLGHQSAAARLYYQVLDVEPHRESAHRGLMTYFALRGDLNQAIQQFKQCTAILRDTMHATPERKTVALCKSILARMDASSREFSVALS